MMRLLDLAISDELDADITVIARDAGINRADVLRRGLAVLKAFKEKRPQFPHMGFVSDPSRLVIEIINVL